MERIPSLAFDFDNVNEFTILKSRIDRIAMWGIKPKKCNSFSILGGSRLYSLATNAFELECNKFMQIDLGRKCKIGYKYNTTELTRGC